VRSKRTEETEIRRADEFSPRPRTSLPFQARVLHYIGINFMRVCRCSNPGRHYEKTFSVASESTHLNASLTLYLDRHNFGSCSIADFQKYRERQKAQWVKNGVNADDFHYVSREKSRSMVCRCAVPYHGYSAPTNPEIVEQCAEYFCLQKGKLTVTKEEWKGIDGDSPPAYSSGLQQSSGYTVELRAPRSHSSDTQLDPFQYDSKSTQEFLESRDEQQDQSSVSREMEMRRSAAPVAPIQTLYRTVLVSPQGETDMPPQVWQHVRSSVRVSNCSAQSTPMGSAFPLTSTVAPAVPAKMPQTHRSTPLDLSQRSQRSSAATYWSDIQSEAGISDKEASPDTPRPHHQRSGSTFDLNIGELPGSVLDPRASVAGAMLGVPPFVHETDTNSSAVFEKGTDVPVASGDMSIPFGFDDYGGVFGALKDTSVAELPAHRSAAELPAQPVGQRDTATLKNLEGRDWDTVSELEKRSTIRVERVEKPLTSRKSTSTSNSARLSSLFEQVLNIAGSSIPDQEVFFL
jgi:hypothetical protein